MSIIEIILVGVGLAMDAFAVSITKGLSMERMRHRDACIIALFFGGFQAIMPMIGWLLGSHFIAAIESVDHWIAFLLLAFIGGKNLKEAFHEDPRSGPADTADTEFQLDIPELLMLAVATSIDALAVGITLALIPTVSIPLAVTLIGVVTFAISYAGVAIGFAFGSKYQRAATIAGGLILISIGLKILLDGLGFL